MNEKDGSVRLRDRLQGWDRRERGEEGDGARRCRCMDSRLRSP